MKNLIFSVFAISLLLMPISGFADTGLVATNSQNQIQVQSTMLPDNPFYFFKTLGWQIQYIFAFSHEAKAQLHAQIAMEQANELAYAKQLGKTELIQTIEQNMNQSMNQLQNELGEAQQAGEQTQTATELQEMAQTQTEEARQVKTGGNQ